MNLRQELALYTPWNEQEETDLRIIRDYLEKSPDAFLRTNETAHFSASAWVVNPQRDKVLMAYHNIYQSWSWTGGHADGEEELLAVAVREVKEETGILHVKPAAKGIFSEEILTVEGHIKHGKYVAPHLHLNITYLLEADEGDALRVKPDENSGVRWMGLEQAVEECREPYMKGIYSKLNQKLLRMPMQ